MISTGIFFVLFIGSTWTKSADGLPYSKVFVQSGPEVVPLEYVSYGPPPVAAPSPAVTQLSAAPIGQLVPCVGQCQPGQQIVSLQSPSAKLVSYKPPVPNIPSVVTPANDNLPLGYQYSYVVYDQNTGDQKTQTELSDGSLVQGQYSLIQPDGFVREVLYTADDLKGFNAIVKNFLPKAEGIEVKKTEPHADPCKHSEALTELSQDAGNTEIDEHHGHEIKHKEGETESQHQEHIDHDLHAEHDEHGEHAEHKEHAVHTKYVESNQILSQTGSGLLSYNDIIKCLQAALQNKNPKTTSPLTYVILNKPC